MKKLFFAAAIAAFAIVLASCGGSKPATPTQAAEKALKQLVDKDYKGYVDNLNFSEKDMADKEAFEKQKEQYTALLGGKIEEGLKDKDGIKEYKVVEEEVKDSLATVKYEITYGNGDTKTDNMKLVLNPNGEWKVDAGK